MSKCIYCAKSGLFLPVDPNGLCSECKLQIYPTILRSVEIIKQSLQLVETSKNWKTRISRIKDIHVFLDRLEVFEQRGLKGILNKPIPDARRETDGLRLDVIREEAGQILKDAVNKAEMSSTPKTKVNAIHKGLLKLNDFEKMVGNDPTINRNRLQLRALAHTLEFKGYIDLAQKAEFKEDFKKALDQYQEALYFLKSDVVDDLKQEKTIKQLELKIAAIKELLAGKAKRIDSKDRND